MKLPDKNHVIFLLTFLSFYTTIIVLSENAYADEFDKIAPMSIIKEDGSTFEIQPKFIVEEGYKVFNNTNVNDNKISLTKGEPIKISYKSPCGFANSIKGLFLKGTIDRTLSAFSENTAQLENIKLNGEQKEFYENSSPNDESIEITGIPEDIPSDIEISGVPNGNEDTNNYKVVLVVDCDEEVIYYTAAAEIKEEQ
ncbi:MAG TPA: hypothetical protein VFM31_03820 [Nitrososphaeraceae archaeon]|nr:hypothetical protein [Nitrososphaeraceae archaeon]